MKVHLIILWIICFAAISPCFAQKDVTPKGYEAQLGFEATGQWHSAPRAILDEKNPDFLWTSHQLTGPGWSVNKVTNAALDSGLSLSRVHVKEGSFSGLWKDPEKFPTISCWSVPGVWSAANTFEISIYSTVKTDEIVTIGVLSDNSATPSKDYYLHDFTVDWTGWKTLRVPFASFTTLGQPAGWDKVGGIYFFSRIFRHRPNPYTVLYLDGIHLIQGANPASQASAAPKFFYQERFNDAPPPLNHTFPETDHPQPFTQPITHQTYFQAEQALYKYYPRFAPGYPSFSPDGKAYINAGDTVEWLDAHGKWVTSDIKAVLIAWAKKQGWPGIYNAWQPQGADPMIRFDKSGDAYIMESVEEINALGKRYDWKTRSTLLLYSRDKMKTWSVYKLPDRIAAFEKLDGHNQDCLNRPPVILLSDYTYFPQADQNGYILIPEKQADGSLTLPKPVKYATSPIDCDPHSGDGNMAITHGHMVYIAYGWCPDTKLRIGDWMASHPPIPADSPGLNQTFTIMTHEKTTEYSKNGVPTYVVAYNIDTHTVSAPVYVGSGGGAMDDHNWPAITIDSKGIITVIINGHHNPVNYTHTLHPYDISSWTAPEYIMAGTDMPNLSYATLTCEKDDTLVTVHRSTKDTYNNHLGMYCKPPGQPWQPEKIIAVPFKLMYKVWYQRMTYDNTRNRLFLTYFSFGSQEWYTWDMYAYHNYIWPDEEQTLDANLGQKDKQDPGPMPPGRFSGAFYLPVATQITMLESDDNGTTWKLATTKDFAAGP